MKKNIDVEVKVEPTFGEEFAEKMSAKMTPKNLAITAASSVLLYAVKSGIEIGRDILLKK